MNKSNMFCLMSDLKNEADVEQSFARRLLEHLGYQDSQIRPKDSLRDLAVGKGRGLQSLYRPDFALKVGNQVRWIFEAKAPDEDLGRHIWQPRGYCMMLNGEHINGNPVKYFVLSNGIVTRLYQFDINDPLIELRFGDFEAGNVGFVDFSSRLCPASFGARQVAQAISRDVHRLEKRPLEDVDSAFSWCHQHIYTKDNISQAAGFTEFVKVISLKLLSDRRIRDEFPDILERSVIDVPADRVSFSSRWIEAESGHARNPLDRIQFSEFLASMEKEISRGERKRFFDEGASINLSPETILGVVRRIEHIFLFGIDVDLNGRLFETFLNATMRGKDLGQFFTPRSVVKLGTKLARLRVHNLCDDGGFHTDIVLDGCCGTGGFLIDALSDMWTKVDQNESLSDTQKTELRNRIKTRHVVGIDLGRDPALARIARLNMYLHGDGGSSIFQVDTLDKQVRDRDSDSPEIMKEKAELRSLFASGGFADVVLTNPPFAKTYEDKIEGEAQILSDYSIFIRPGGNRRPSLKSSLMFIERYHDLLKPGGRLITVIDDGILSGGSYAWFRDYIREHFVIRAVISLPGDAFQRSLARVKTSLLIAEKRESRNSAQPPVFMYPCQYVGIDDPARKRTLPIDHHNRSMAKDEIREVVKEYLEFLGGGGILDLLCKQGSSEIGLMLSPA